MDVVISAGRGTVLQGEHFMILQIALCVVLNKKIYLFIYFSCMTYFLHLIRDIMIKADETFQFNDWRS